jgi:hypothetical protein
MPHDRPNARPSLWIVPLLAVCAFSLDISRTADAAWPPPLDATSEDMKNPANWPNDPAYGYVASEIPKDRRDGQWTFYSFIPERSPNAPPLRPGETASGMSIDLAWRHTTGDDRVLIAVLDSGIRWDEPDLIEKAYLNKGELRTHPPLKADGSACAPLDPAQPTQDLFDCNGDGIFTISDYADHPGLWPEAEAGHPRGDANRNGVFDAGDLIVMKTASGVPMFSDGIDDDQNGYVDDIAGWDFMKDDNDPYDDTRYGHGTGEARDSAAATNNGIGGAGVCPRCRFVPLRVGDSFIADVQDYARAVIYAADNGAQVVQEALGTINMSTFAQKAMDYAWAKGTVIVASMADENARHHNVPATANHTMPVHAITMSGTNASSTTAESFLAFNTCTNFGAQNYLSASGTGCSSEATGKLSGLAGLVYSMGLQAKLEPALSAGEVLQLFQATADDIYVPESQQPDSAYYWSQPGFDQRFGYGRVNGNAAVEAVKAGRIPPDVDIVRPYWFEVLYKDQLTAPVEIIGTISARRAPAYSYRVEWAPGVQPLDGEFKVIAELLNIKGSIVTGADGSALAQLDVREIDVSHPRDPDSPLGENDRTFTVRVRATAHYGGTLGDVGGELRRAYYVHEDKDLLDGFPIYLGGSGESSPKLADIDGDGRREIVVGTADGVLHVLTLKNGRPQPVAGFPFRVKRLQGLAVGDNPSYLEAPAYKDPAGVSPELGRESISATPAIADLNGDGKLEIVVTTYDGTIYVVRSDGSVMPGWPIMLPAVPSCALDEPKQEPCMDTTTRITRGAFASPVVADMDGDGKREIIQAAFDGNVYIKKLDGTDLPGWPVRPHYTGPGGGEYNRIMTTPAVTDFNGDGIPDLVVGSNEKINTNSGAFYLLDGRGTLAPGGAIMPNWPITEISLNIFPLVGEGVPNSPAAADFDGDGVPEAVMHGNGSKPRILPTDPGKQPDLGADPPNTLPQTVDPETGEPMRGLAATAIFGPASTAARPDTMFPLFAQPSIGDLDQDGTPDVVSSGGSLSMAQSLASTGTSTKRGQHLLSMWNGKTGKMMPASPIVIEDFTFFNNQAIADLTNDGYPEVITGSGGYFVHAVDACGRQPEGWPKFTGQWVAATTAVGDLDGDDELDVVVNSRAGWLYAWKTRGRTDGVIAWESFHHDNANTGDLGTPLDQGTLRGNAPPLPLDADGYCVLSEDEVPEQEGRLEPSGGCLCSAPGRAPSSGWLLLALPTALLARRRALRRIA